MPDLSMIHSKGQKGKEGKDFYRLRKFFNLYICFDSQPGNNDGDSLNCFQALFNKKPILNSEGNRF